MYEGMGSSRCKTTLKTNAKGGERLSGESFLKEQSPVRNPPRREKAKSSQVLVRIDTRMDIVSIRWEAQRRWWKLKVSHRVFDAKRLKTTLLCRFLLSIHPTGP